MNNIVNHAIEILENLVAFQSLSGQPNLDIVDYVSGYLSEHGITSSLSYDKTRQQANLFATIGPEIDGGVVLNGHTDVVPVAGQPWTSDPFKLTRKDERLYGRGAVDMKGFLACVLASVPHFNTAGLKLPIHIAFTFDEEIGGFGMPVLLDSLEHFPYQPGIVIVGEPTEMGLITGHKGGYEMRTEITGAEVHSCDPTKGVNAISAAVKLIGYIESIAAQRAAKPVADSPFEPPYCTFNVGTIAGGIARNATAGRCEFNWEFRPMPGEDSDAIIADIHSYTRQKLLPEMQAVSPTADIKTIIEAPVPPLDDANAEDAATFISEITGLNSRGVVSFGTDGGYFSNAGFSTVVFGPGSIARAHKADEYIEINELAEGCEFLEKVADRLSR